MAVASQIRSREIELTKIDSPVNGGSYKQKQYQISAAVGGFNSSHQRGAKMPASRNCSQRRSNSCHYVHENQPPDRTRTRPGDVPALKSQRLCDPPSCPPILILGGSGPPAIATVQCSTYKMITSSPCPARSSRRISLVVREKMRQVSATVPALRTGQPAGRCKRRRQKSLIQDEPKQLRATGQEDEHSGDIIPDLRLIYTSVEVFTRTHVVMRSSCAGV